MATSDNDYFLVKLKKCILLETPRVLAKVAKDLYKLNPSSNEGQLTIDEFCVKNFKKKARKILGNKYFKSEAFNVSYNEAQDISFGDCHDIIALCKRTDKDRYEALFPKGKDYYKNLIDLKNKISHDDFDIPRNDVEFTKSINQEKARLLVYVSKICEICAKSFKDENYLTVSNDFKKGVKSIWKSPHGIFDIEDVVSVTICQACKSLKKRYRLLEDLQSPFAENFASLKIEEIFTNVALRYKGIPLPYDEILSKSPPGRKEIDPAVVINGHFGSGKTTLCKQIVKNWCDSQLREFNLLIFIKCKEVKTSNVITYISENLVPEVASCLQFDDELFKYILCNLNILFVIDGYDEFTPEGKKFFNNLLSIFAEKKILVTTRVEQKDEVCSRLKEKELVYLDINLIGFESSQREDFIDKMWQCFINNNISPGNKDDFKKSLKSREDIFKDLLNLPLFNVLFIYLWIYGHKSKSFDRILTVTILYEEIFEMLKDHLIQKLLSSSSNQYANELTTKVEELLEIISGECYRLYRSNCSSIDQKFVDVVVEFCSQKEIDVIIFFSSFFHGHGKNGKKSFTEYEFLHLSQMEYLVAKHIVNMINIRKMSCDELINPNSDGPVRFVIGILNKNLEMKLIKELLNGFPSDGLPNNFQFYWKVLVETRMPDNSKTSFCFNEVLIRYLNTERLANNLNWHLKGPEIMPGLNLLNVTKKNIQELIIDIPQNIDPYDIPYFLDVLSNLKSSLKGSKMFLQIHFENHYRSISREVNSQKEDSSIFLRCFYSWGLIKKFTGYLKDANIDLFPYFENVKDICLRFTTIEPLKNFHSIVNKLNKLGRIRIILDMKWSEVCALNFPTFQTEKPDLELNFYHIKSKELVLIRDVIKKLSGDLCVCNNVALYNTKAKPEDFLKCKFMAELVRFIYDKLTIQTIDGFSKSEVDKLRIHKCSYTLDWHNVIDD